MNIYLPSSKFPEILYDFFIFSSILSNSSGAIFSKNLLQRLIIGKILITPIEARTKIIEAETKLIKNDVNPNPKRTPNDIAIYDKGNVCSSILSSKEYRKLEI